MTGRGQGAAEVGVGGQVVERTIDVERAVRFFDARGLLMRRLPWARTLSNAELAPCYGLSLEAFECHLARLQERVEAGARRLASEDAVATAVRRPPWSPRARIVFFGDSLVADLQSWARIVESLLSLTHGTAGPTVMNAGVSGDTTADALKRVQRICGLQPDLVVGLLGTNDAGTLPNGEQLVTDPETERNLRVMDTLLRESARTVVWIAPPLVDERAAEQDPAREPGIRCPLDIVSRKSQIVRQVDPNAIDLRRVFGRRARAGDLLGVDGVHPSFDGHLEIARVFLAACG